MVMIASVGYTGKLPLAPGTWGTMAGLLFYWGIYRIPGWVFAVTIVALFFLGVLVAAETDRVYGTSDNGMIVIDEVVGLWIAMWGLPFTFQTAVLGFILFRLFDVVKPFPVRWIEQRVPGGWGVMLDDVSAGIYTQISLRVILMMAGS